MAMKTALLNVIFSNNILFSLVLLLMTLSSTFADLKRQCKCVNAGMAIYEGTCGTNEVIVFKRPILGVTRDKSDPQFCSKNIDLNGNDCVLLDSDNGWTVANNCNSKTSCMGEYKVDQAHLNSCGATFAGYTYLCMEYECIPSNINGTGTAIPAYSMSVPGKQSYNPPLQFQLQTINFPSTTSTQINQCSIKIAPQASIIFRIQDLRSSGPIAAGPCPYLLYIYTGDTYTQWCAPSTEGWVYQEQRVTAGLTSQQIDVVFFSKLGASRSAGSAWITTEANHAANVTCGSDIELLIFPNASTTTRLTTTLTTTRLPAATTTTVAIPTARPPSTTTATRLTTVAATVPTTTTRAAAATTTTTRANPGATTVTTTQATTKLNPSSTTTPSKVSSLSTTKSNPSATTTTSKVSSIGTTKPNLSSTTTPSKVSILSTAKPSGSSTTTKSISTPPHSPTPGVPGVSRSTTPGVPRNPNVADLQVGESVSSDDTGGSTVIKQVAITVAVIVGGLVLIIAIAALVYWAVNRNNGGRLVSPRNSGYEATLE